jgi:hypothetical protein
MNDKLSDCYIYANGSSAKPLICKRLRMSEQAEQTRCRGRTVVQPARAESPEYTKPIRVWHGRESCDARKWFYSRAMEKGQPASSGWTGGANASGLAPTSGSPDLEKLPVGF